MSVLNPNTATGSLGFSDLDNQARFKTSTSSMGLSSGGFTGSKDIISNMGGGIPITGGNSGDASSTTHAAVSDGTITIRDTDKQQQNVAGLSRDVEHANNALSPIFDKEKEQNRLREAQLIGEIGSQVSDVIRTQGKIIATKAANEKMLDVSEKDKVDAKAQWEKANPGQVATAEDINGQVYKTAYDQAFNESGYGTGGKFQQAAQAATAAIQGLAGGDMSKALAGASAPYLAEVIHNMTTDANGKVNVEANLMAHAVLGAVVAQVNGNSALAGASGAVMGEYIAQKMYPGINREDLTEEQRQTISALGTLAAGLTGGLAGGNTADAVAGAQAGKNALENNNFNFGKGMADIGMSQTSLGASMRQSGATPDEITAALLKNSQGETPEGQDPIRGLLTAWGEFFGVPVSVLTSHEAMTPEKAAEILASGIPTSEAKLMQYVFAKALLTVTKGTTVKAETGNTLIYNDNFGGHAVQKHVGKTDAELIARLNSDPRVLASSTFSDMKSAERAIGNGLAENKDQLTNWLAGNQDRLVLQHEELFNVGRVIPKGSTESHYSNKIVIVIDRDPLMPSGYRIQTAYPK
ncbi:TPA: VENN motif pre-toxin domain-containing protein [Yersinia enterocolitica]|nr:VENN motif pre-toxin domain-containing protein [Yersinia enterocolitica]HDY4929483.1 VENN motif pre-toxin domain-containing protein [Yersinia enterocolitica]HEC1634468.1 VENN motif pre-toxin domain-containing protein [Yersinia enterocolitica]HED0386858.1 VENN motif pre-toxin domain-containing protein [Yersinia enterocolitica]